MDNRQTETNKSEENIMFLESESNLDEQALVDSAEKDIIGGSFYFNSFSNGILSLLTYGDYFIVVTILITFLSRMRDEKTIAAAGYQFGFFSIIVFAFNTGTIEAMGVYGSQAFSKEDFKRVNLLLRQCILILISLYLVFGLGLGYFSNIFYKMLGVDDITAELTRDLIFYVSPGLLLRVISDLFKSFLQCQSKIRIVGYANIGTLVIFVLAAYPIMITYELGLLGYGIGVLIYEGISFLLYLYFYFFHIDILLRDTSLPLTEHIGWLLWECCKNTGANFASHISYELILIIITQIGDVAQTAAYSLVVIIPSIMYYVVEGFNIYPRTVLNFRIGRGELNQAKETILKTLLLNFGLAIILPAVTFLIIMFMENYGTSSVIVMEWVHKCTFAMMVYTLGAVLYCVAKVLGITLELKEEIFYIGIIFAVIMRTILCFAGVIFFGCNIVEIVFLMMTSEFCRFAVLLIYILKKDLNDISGVKGQLKN